MNRANDVFAAVQGMNEAAATIALLRRRAERIRAGGPLADPAETARIIAFRPKAWLTAVCLLAAVTLEILMVGVTAEYLAQRLLGVRSLVAKAARYVAPAILLLVESLIAVSLYFASPKPWERRFSSAYRILALAGTLWALAPVLMIASAYYVGARPSRHDLILTAVQALIALVIHVVVLLNGESIYRTWEYVLLRRDQFRLARIDRAIADEQRVICQAFGCLLEQAGDAPAKTLAPAFALLTEAAVGEMRMLFGTRWQPRKQELMPAG